MNESLDNASCTLSFSDLSCADLVHWVSSCREVNLPSNSVYSLVLEISTLLELEVIKSDSS